jgi:hypothetical protein
MSDIKSKVSHQGEQTSLNKQGDNFLTLRELCDQFRINKRTVYAMVRDGLPEYRFSERKAMYEYNQVKTFLLNNKK